MINIPTLLSLLSKHGSDVLDFLKKHWRITLEVIGVLWVVVCLLTHCNSPIEDVAPDPIQPISVIAPNIPTPILMDEPIRIRTWNAIEPPVAPATSTRNGIDSIAYLLEVTDWLQNRLYMCDSAYTDDTGARQYSDEFETDSIKVGYSIVVSGRLKEPPQFVFTPKWSAPTELVNPRGIYLEGSFGPVMSYGDQIRLQAIRGEVGIGVFNRKGWSYGAKVGASQLGWDVQASFRRNFSVGVSTKSR